MPRPERSSPGLPLTTSEDFAPFASEWAMLHHRVDGAHPFQHPGWLSCWLRHFQPEAPHVYLSVRLDDHLVGAVPLLLGAPAATFLGDPEIMDYAPVLAAHGAEEAVARGILEWLAEDMAPAATLWGFRESDPLLTALTAQSLTFGWDATVEEEAIAPAATCLGDFDAFVASLSKKDRHELRRKMRNLEAAGDVRFEELTEPGDVERAMDRFIHLMRISRPDKDEFLTDRMEAFFRDAANTTAALGCARIGQLTLDGQVVAMTWSFETGAEELLYNSGFDPGHAGLSLGIVSKAYAIRAGAERGVQTFDFLRGDEDYKHRLGGQPRRVLRVHLRSRAT